MVKKPSAKIDSLLEPLLPPASDHQADEFIAQLISDHAQPVIKGIIRYKLHLSSHDSSQRAESEDIYQDALVQFLTELRRFRTEPDLHPITDARGLAAVIAHRTCSRWMRRQYPERHAFKARLHYLLTRQRGLALWQNENGKQVAGFEAWKSQKQTAPPERLLGLSNEEGLLAQLESLKAASLQRGPGAALAGVLNYLGAPVEFDELVGTLASLLQIRDQPLESTDQNEDVIGFAAAAGDATAWLVEKRIFLQRLWEELGRLPRNQRAALLLNLKDAEGRGCIALFSITGIATLRQLADVLEMGAEEFAELWNELPLEDARIAEMLQLTRQQVINARKSGRERLTRRLKGFI